jgi:spermidine synthase
MGRRSVAVLGGGDGMAVREILKYPGVESVTLVELDPAMTRLFGQRDAAPPQWRCAGLAQAAHRQPTPSSGCRARRHVRRDRGGLPDPTNFAIGKLYTNSFYALLDQRLAASGYAVVQTTSPLVARKSFWTVVRPSNPWA